MSTTPGDAMSGGRDDVTSDSVTEASAGAELGTTEGGSTFEPEEDVDGEQ